MCVRYGCIHTPKLIEDVCIPATASRVQRWPSPAMLPVCVYARPRMSRCACVCSYMYMYAYRHASLYAHVKTTCASPPPCTHIRKHAHINLLFTFIKLLGRSPLMRLTRLCPFLHLLIMLIRTHACTHACTHARTHAHTRTRTRTHIQEAQMHPYMHKNIQRGNVRKKTSRSLATQRNESACAPPFLHAPLSHTYIRTS